MGATTPWLRATAFGAALALVGGAWWAASGDPVPTTSDPLAATAAARDAAAANAAASDAAPATIATADTDASAKAMAAFSTAAGGPHCPHQQVEFIDVEGPQRACLTTTQAQQIGSVRRLLLRPEAPSRWTLQIDLAGGQVVSARLSRPVQGLTPARLYRCEGGGCQGLRLDRADARGDRQIWIDGRFAVAWPSGETGVKGSAATPVPVRARLHLPLDQQRVAACEGVPLQVIEGDGAVSEFCAAGGAGFELADDGQTHYRFRDLQGRSLDVSLATDGSIDQVALGRLRCRAPQCGGVTQLALGTPGDPAAARRFSFSGTTLRSDGAVGGATLNGSVDMPGQE